MKKDLLTLKRAVIILICFGLLAGCSNSQPDAKESRKDDIAATKKQVKALCKKVDLDVFKLSRAVDYDANLEQLKKNYKDINDEYKLIRTAIKKLPAKHLTGAEQKMAKALVEDLNVIIKNLPIYSELLFQWYIDVEYTEVPLVDEVRDSTMEKFNFKKAAGEKFTAASETYASEIDEKEEHFWTNVRGIYPYLCLGVKVDYTRLQSNNNGY